MSFGVRQKKGGMGREDASYDGGVNMRGGGIWNLQKEMRSGACLAVLKGLISAVCVTLPGMALIAVLAVYASLSDGALTALNQILKLTAIFIGAYRAVGRGGTRGLALGGAVGLIYIALGYGICALWEEALITGGMLALEFLAGLALGGVSGALTANLPAGKGRIRRAG